MDKHTKAAILQHIVRVTHAEVRVFNTSTQIDYYGQKRREKSFVNEANIVSLLKKKLNQVFQLFLAVILFAMHLLQTECHSII